MVTEENAGLKVLVIYICVSRGQNTASYSKRFAETWLANPPGCSCDLLIVNNGMEPAASIKSDHDRLASKFVWGTIRYLNRPNTPGWDIEAYLEVAHSIGSGYDFLVCLGESVHFWRGGWLARWVEARQQLGPGMYGPLATFNVRAHLHTTAFGVDPVYLRNYPMVRNHPERYEFEHGNGALWKRVKTSGGGAWLVTWSGIYRPEEWRDPQNIIWDGTQEECLLWCNHTERFRDASPETRYRWRENANGPFRL
jgi:hypothetical protein